MASVEKVFWSDPYLTVLTSKVANVQGNIITLERTIFYAFSGGQESDHGTIGKFSVLEARKDGRQIYYKLDEGHGLKSGDEVMIQIDWVRRYLLMRLHFAAEIVLELFYKRFPGIEKIGAHISADKARIDFKWADNFTNSLAEIQTQVNEIVSSDTLIISAFDDFQMERRSWEIPGFSKVPCGGTHLKRTSEIGAIRLKRDNVGKGKQRVVVFVN
jgi:Ser-tRNA(Ala) deacylase AlaX